MDEAQQPQQPPLAEQMHACGDRAQTTTLTHHVVSHPLHQSQPQNNESMHLHLYGPLVPFAEDLLQEYIAQFSHRIRHIVAKALSGFHSAEPPEVVDAVVTPRDPIPDALEFRMPFISAAEARERLMDDVLKHLQEQGVLMPPPGDLLDAIFSESYFGHPTMRFDLEFFLPRILRTMLMCIHEGRAPLYRTEEGMALIEPRHLMHLYTRDEWREVVLAFMQDNEQETPPGLDKAAALHILTTQHPYDRASESDSAEGSEDAGESASKGCGEGVHVAGPTQPIPFDPARFDTTSTLSSWLAIDEAHAFLSFVRRLTAVFRAGDFVVFFGNTPHLSGRLVEALLAAQDPALLATLAIEYLPFSGSPNRQRSGKKINWRHALTEQRRQYLRGMLAGKYGLTAARMASRRFVLVDLIGTGAGPFYLLNELMDMNGGAEPWSEVVIASLTDLPSPRGKAIHDTVYRAGRLYYPTIDTAHMSVPVITLGLSDEIGAKLDKTMAFQRYLPFNYTMYWQPTYEYLHSSRPSRFAARVLEEFKVLLLQQQQE